VHVELSGRVDCTASLLAQRGGRELGSRSSLAEQSTTGSLARSLYIYLFIGATLCSAPYQLFEWVQWGNFPPYSLSRPLYPCTTPFLLAMQRRNGRFLSIDRLLTTLDQSQAERRRPVGLRRARCGALRCGGEADG